MCETRFRFTVSSPAEKDFKVLADEKLNRSLPGACGVQKDNPIPSCILTSQVSRWEKEDLKD